jgi:hypothetical protein
MVWLLNTRDELSGSESEPRVAQHALARFCSVQSDA